MQIHKKTLCVFIFSLFLGMTVHGQINYYSLLSRQGMGDVTKQGALPVQSMGYLEATYYSPYHVNYSNPASYGYLSMASFDIGMNVQNIRLDYADESKKFLTGGLDYISVAVPLINPLNKILDKKSNDFQIGLVFGLRPYTKVGYRTDVRDSLNIDGEYRNIVRQYEGTGGTYIFTTGFGAKYKDFSAGLNFNYLYGKITREKVFWLPWDEINGFGYSDHFFNTESYKAWTLEFGTMYDIFTKRNLDNPHLSNKVTVGASGRFNQKITVDEGESYYKREYLQQGIENGEFRIPNSDTISVTDVTNKGTLPSVLNLGLMYHHENKWKVGANVDLESWSRFKKDESDSEVLKNSIIYSIGGEYTPDETSYNNLWKRIRYRGGIYTGTDPRIDSGEQVKTWGLESGVGIPIFQARQISFINLGVSYRNLDSGNLSENYFTFKFGLTFNNNLWFYKRRFD